MEQSKLWKLLLGLDRNSQQELLRFVASPFFNRSATIIAICTQCCILIQAQKKPNKERLWEQVFPEKPFNDVRFRKLCSDLVQLLEEFLAHDALRNNPLQQSMMLLEAVHLRYTQPLQSGSVAQVKEVLNCHTKRNAEFYFDSYHIENIAYELSNFETQHMEKSNVEDIINNLDTFYLSEKLRLYCTVLSRRNIVSHDYNLLFIDQIVDYVEKVGFVDTPPIYIYFLVLQTLRDPDNEAVYQLLIRYTDAHKISFPPKELYHIYGQALNCCIYFINRGNITYLQEYKRLFEHLLLNKLALHPGSLLLSPWRFTNTVSVYNRLGDYLESEKFVNQYKDLLPAEFAKNAVTYNLAQVYFYQKRFDEVLLQLREVEYDDVTYNLGAKSILLATYYEKREWEALQNLLDTFNTYLNRQKTITEDRRNNYKNLIRFLRRLMNHHQNDREWLAALQIEVDSAAVASKKWLLDKIIELQPNKVGA